MKFCATAVVWGAAATLLALLGAFFGGGLNPFLAGSSLLLGAGVAIAAGIRTAPGPGIRQLTWVQALMLGVFALACLRAFLWLAVESGGKIFIGSPFNMGDLALHWQMIAHFAAGAEFWPESPIYPGEPLRYPLGINLLNALAVLCGAAMIPSLVWVGLLGGAATAWTLMRWGGAFGLAMFLFNAGWVGWNFSNPGWLAEGHAEMDWKNLFLSVFVTQRGILWALPAGCLLLMAWYERMQRIHEGRSVIPAWVEVLLYASLPLFHFHTFFFLSILLATCFVFAPSRETRMQFLRTGLLAFLPATILVWLVTAGFAAGSGLGWHPGWMGQEQGFAFWWKNFGLWLLVLAWLPIAMVRRKAPAADWAFVGVALGFIALCMMVRFAPWAWDNIKLLLWSWLVLAPFFYRYVFEPIPLFARVPALILIFFQGALILSDGLSKRHSYEWADRSELASTQAALAGINPARSRIATAPDFNHPAALLGYRMSMGYPGHLWSHGYDYQDLQTRLTQLFEGTAPSPESTEFPATHLLLGPREIQFFELPQDHSPFPRPPDQQTETIRIWEIDPLDGEAALGIRNRAAQPSR